MIKRVFFILLLLIIQIYNVKSAEAFYPEASFFSENNDFVLHTIERGQTVYSIANLYHVSVEDIYEWNPGSREGIKAGDTLKIYQAAASTYHTIQPKETLFSVSRNYQLKGEDILAANPGLSIENFNVGKIIRIPSANQTVVAQNITNTVSANSATSATSSVKSTNKVKIALLLPFDVQGNATSDNASKNKYVEYYEGFLLALNDLKAKGISVHLQVYDIGNGTSSLESLLRKSDLQTVNLLLGGSSNEQIRLISGFSEKMGIPYVIPFTAVSDEPTVKNPNTYQVNASPLYLYAKTSLAFYNQFKDANIIFLNSNKDSEKSDLIDQMKEDLTARRTTYTTTYEDNATALSYRFHSNRRNVIVPSDDSKETLLRVIASIKEIKNSQPNMDVVVFGYPSWQIYSNDYAADFSRCNVTFFTAFYADPSSPTVKSFNSQFRRWYSRDMINRFPKYGILGYDTGMYFVQLLNQYGISAASNINKVKYDGVQMDFHFDRINNSSGFVNTHLYFVEFNSKSSKPQIKKID